MTTWKQSPGEGGWPLGKRRFSGGGLLQGGPSSIKGSHLIFVGIEWGYELLSFIRSVYLKLSEVGSHRHKRRNVHARGRIEKTR